MERGISFSELKKLMTASLDTLMYRPFNDGTAQTSIVKTVLQEGTYLPMAEFRKKAKEAAAAVIDRWDVRNVRQLLDTFPNVHGVPKWLYGCKTLSAYLGDDGWTIVPA